MKSITIALVATTAAAPLFAQQTREMDAHVHGVSTLEIAVEGTTVEMNLIAPGADIVGFEYEATSDADLDAVDAAIRTLLMPETIVTLPDAADCRLAEVLVHLHGHDEHNHDADMEEADHAHDHADEQEEDHDHGANHEGEHDDAAGAVHSEFHARYVFDCQSPDALTAISLPFFDRFETAQEVEAVYVLDTGAGQAEITRDAPELTLDRP
ncbi:zinc uptake protein ZrgA [Roseobacter sp. HKCCA0434]|uniref:zinc uptake protein ZrgA n=1 Tax=Roseobacter sp. HKCCA0434 TaxID=3079297 RepID=UPI002905AB88|nr:DUF2796 domain-containing protein [Roseobacter sp. HKCCA0434]